MHASTGRFLTPKEEVALLEEAADGFAIQPRILTRLGARGSNRPNGKRTPVKATRVGPVLYRTPTIEMQHVVLSPDDERNPTVTVYGKALGTALGKTAAVGKLVMVRHLEYEVVVDTVTVNYAVASALVAEANSLRPHEVLVCVGDGC